MQAEIEIEGLAAQSKLPLQFLQVIQVSTCRFILAACS
jgi:hypothetical protein